MNALSAFEQVELQRKLDAALNRIVELEKRLRLAALEKYEKPPVEPEEVYSPKMEVIND